jgi:hypothetical protein
VSAAGSPTATVPVRTAPRHQIVTETSGRESAAAGPMTPAHWVRVGCVVVLGFLAGSEWHRVFGWGPVVGRVAAAAILAAAVSVISRVLRPTRAGAGIVISLVLGAWFLAVVALHDAVGVIVPTPSALGGIAGGLVNGWAGILSVPLPVPAQGEYLVLPVALTWLAVLAGAELVLRSRWPLAGAVPPALAYALTLLFGIGAPGSRLVSSSLFLAVTLVLAGASARPIVVESASDRGARRRRTAEVGGCLAAVVLLAVMLGPSLPFVGSGHPYNPRTSRIPPETAASTLNPLDQLSVWALHPHGATLLTVHWSGSPQPLQLAVLDHYGTLDGWTGSSRFAPAGTQLPEIASGHAVATTTAHQDVSVDALPGPWLPAASEPVQVSGTRVLVDPTTGTLIAAGSTRNLRYQVTSVVPTKDCTLDQAVPFAPGAAPVLPAVISSLADQYAGGAQSPCARATELAAAFEQHFSYNPKAPSGSSIQVLENFLQGPKDEDGGTGTYEQAAAACALMAEALGMKARVVVGFHAGHPLGHGTYEIRPDDAYAWVQIDFVGAGWVSFYPTLRHGPTPKTDQADQGSSQLRHNPDQITPKSGAPVERATPSQLHRQQGSTLAVVGVVLGIVLLLLLVLLGMAAATVRAVRRRRRKRRRATADPRQQVIGAWEESLDLLAAAGVRRQPWETAGEVVSSGTVRLGGEAAASLVPLAKLSNAARYSDQIPTAADAKAAWTCTDSLSAVTDGVLGRWARWRRALDVRIVFRRGGR